MSRKKRTKDELIKASEHLWYEFAMLNNLANGLASGIFATGTLNNALLESFAIHVRSLIDFLYPEKVKNDAVISEDYFDSPEIWKKIIPNMSGKLAKAKIRAHKEIVHLTYERLKVTPETKPWHFLEIRDEINKIMNIFLIKVNKGLLGESFKNIVEVRN